MKRHWPLIIIISVVISRGFRENRYSLLDGHRTDKKNIQSGKNTIPYMIDWKPWYPAVW